MAKQQLIEELPNSRQWFKNLNEDEKDRLATSILVFFVLIIGVMLGYAWCLYHLGEQGDVTQTIFYRDYELVDSRMGINIVVVLKKQWPLITLDINGHHLA